VNPPPTIRLVQTGGADVALESAQSQTQRPALRAAGATVSVIIPCYNYGHFLQGCLDSVLSQTGVNVKVLVIDDCSPDGSAEVASAICAADPRVEFRAHRANAGLIPTANEGLEWATGDYVVLLSADDLLVPGALWRAASVMERNPDVGLVYGRSLYAREDQPMPGQDGRWRGTKIWRGEDWIRTRCRTGFNAMSSPEVVVRTSVQHAVGGYDRACYHTSDLHMWLRVAAVSDIAYISGAPQAVYRIHGQSMQRSQETALVDLSERRGAFDRFFAEHGPALSQAENLSTTVRRRLARQALWEASRTVDRGVPETQDLVDGLVAFALDVYPGAPRLREWHGFTVRRRLGPGRSRLFVPFALTGIAHRLAYHARMTRWRYRGI
jgi:GT2 family glycosyltransferase